MKNRKSKFLDQYKESFENLRAAFAWGTYNVALVEATEKRTRRKRAVICAVNYIDDDVEMIPIATMIDCKDFHKLIPPK